MKYVVILADGMSDYPVLELDGKTPIQYANCPNMDFMAKYGELGMVQTVPDNMPPASDIANLSVLGYDPLLYYTGRSPLEAVSMGINLLDTDVAMRCNLVTLSDEDIYSEKTMLDYSSDEISTLEARELINAIEKELGDDSFKFHTGISYRHCLVWQNGTTGLSLIPPHDISDKKIANYLPNNSSNSLMLEKMIKSNQVLKNHPVNLNRIAKGLNPANSIWLWGEGKKPNIPSYKSKFGINGSMISAVDLLKGIAIFAGLDSINVEGVTGNIHTNYKGKAIACLNELESGKDFVYIHIEAPDECGHRGEVHNKVKSIELIDSEITGFLLNHMQRFDDFKIMILPDHSTPVSLKTHTSNPVPYAIYRKGSTEFSEFLEFSESTASKSSNYFGKGYELIHHFFK